MALKQETKQKIADALAEAIVAEARVLGASHVTIDVDRGAVCIFECRPDYPGACPIEEVG